MERNLCVGISYSHKEGHTMHCHMCLDDTLKAKGDNFGFYRRQGIVDVWLLNTKDVSNLSFSDSQVIAMYNF